VVEGASDLRRMVDNAVWCRARNSVPLCGRFGEAGRVRIRHFASPWRCKLFRSLWGISRARSAKQSCSQPSFCSQSLFRSLMAKTSVIVPEADMHLRGLGPWLGKRPSQRHRRRLAPDAVGCGQGTFPGGIALPLPPFPPPKSKSTVSLQRHNKQTSSFLSRFSRSSQYIPRTALMASLQKDRCQAAALENASFVSFSKDYNISPLS
jgi:hypothetical protein